MVAASGRIFILSVIQNETTFLGHGLVFTVAFALQSHHSVNKPGHLLVFIPFKKKDVTENWHKTSTKLVIFKNTCFDPFFHRKCFVSSHFLGMAEFPLMSEPWQGLPPLHGTRLG